MISLTCQAEPLHGPGLLVTCELAEVNPSEEISWSTQLATSASFLQKGMLLLRQSFVDWIEKCFAVGGKKDKN